MAHENKATAKDSSPITLGRDEMGLYDRQIRLWGLASQKLIRTARIWIIGDFGTTLNELLKNILLNGFGNVSLITLDNYSHAFSTKALAKTPMLFADHTRVNGGPTTLAELVKTIIQNARSMNQSVALTHQHFQNISSAFDSSNGSASLPDVLLHVADYSLDFSLPTEINEVCRRHGTSFMYLSTVGYYAIMFVDLMDGYKFLAGTGKSMAEQDPQDETKEQVEETIEFVSLRHALNVHQQRLALESSQTITDNSTAPTTSTKTRRPRNIAPTTSPILAAMYSIAESEGRPFFAATELQREIRDAIDEAPLPAVSSFVAAVATQEVVKAITGRDRPVFNLLVFDGRLSDASIITLS